MRPSASPLRRNTILAALLPLAAVLHFGCGDTNNAAVDASTSGDAQPRDGSTAGTDSTVLADLTVDPDTTAPTVLSTSPGSDEVGVATSERVEVTFSEAMAPSSINANTLTLKVGSTAIGGAVSYVDGFAIFTPDLPFGLGVLYSATVSTGVTDVAGNHLAAPYTWSFTTDSTKPLGPAVVFLGSAGNYVVLAKSAVSTVPTSAVKGNIGLSPAAASYITGFSLTRVGTYWSTPQVVGKVFAADNDPPTPTNLTTAVGNMQTAYTDAAGRSLPDFLNLGSAGDIGGLTFVPGLYKWTSSVTIPSDLTFSGGANDVWILQVSGDVGIAAAKQVKLIGGARAKNIFWQVTGTVKMGTAAHFEGVVLCQTDITLSAGASINGRLLAQTAVSLASSTVTTP